MSSPCEQFDVLVIGAGPAGGSAAIRTRAAGLSTLVVEKSTFPRFRIGESLLPASNELLRELGVWPDLQAAGYIKKRGARFHLGHGDREKKIVFADGRLPALDHAWQVDRARFDTLLLDRAREVGAEVRTATNVSRVEPVDHAHQATLVSADGTTTTVRARYVIDAAGRDRAGAGDLRPLPEPVGHSRRIAIYNHFTGIPREAGPTGGDTIIVRLAHGWFWLIPIDERRTSVGLVTTQTDFKAAGLTPAAFFARTVDAQPRLRALFARAEAVMGYHVTADYSYRHRSLAGDRTVQAGDAVGFLDPIFSSGVHLALDSAKLAAGLVIEAARNDRPISPRAARRYTREIRSRTGVFHRLIEAFYDDHAFAVFMCPNPPLGLAPTIISIVAGHTNLRRGMWWRFQLFLFVCRLQRHIPLVPAVSLSPA